jgi:hypothetical protein
LTCCSIARTSWDCLRKARRIPSGGDSEHGEERGGYGGDLSGEIAGRGGRVFGAVGGR